MTVELGTEKALVVLGVSQQLLEEQVFPLKRRLGHQDVELLALEIMYSTKGEYIEQKLSELTKKVGRPVQIIADHGSDIQTRISHKQ
ncbi:Transposase [Nostoc flagelliforme CCNUN1]|uniref:Transposase n=1 Tax=Nostoc flagelliforme CCNUN1 TaxID=2038116 RepID=A0A2K8SGF7_9NOSO|nr:Transposase [Nostoc flagelliforme CCNUN1]